MDPIETLMLEHRQIERALAALESFAAGLRSGAPSAERAELADFAQFFAGYADRFHHGKEEDLLFAAMVECGFPRESGPLAVMLHEHEVGRGLVRELRAIGDDGSGPMSGAERQRAASAALEFAAMLRGHIAKEDRVLYPMAEAHLPEAEFERLGAAFERIESAQGAEADRLCERVDALAHRLVAGGRFGDEPHGGDAHDDGDDGDVGASPSPTSRTGGCCGCGG